MSYLTTRYITGLIVFQQNTKSLYYVTQAGLDTRKFVTQKKILKKLVKTSYFYGTRFFRQVDILFRVVLWDTLPCKMIVDRRFRGAYCLLIPDDGGSTHL